MIGTLRKLQKLISKFPSKARAPHSPQHSTREARAPHSPPAQYQGSQSSPQPSTVPAKPGLPTAPQHSTSKARAPHSALHSTSKARASHSPQHSTSETRAPHSPPVQYQGSQGSPQPPSTVPAKPGLPTAPPSTVPVKPGLPQPPSAVPATRDHHRDCLHLSSARRRSQPPGTITGTACLSPAPEEAPSHQGPSQGLPASPQHQKKLPATRDHHRACLSSVNIHWIFIHSNWKHHD